MRILLSVRSALAIVVLAAVAAGFYAVFVSGETNRAVAQGEPPAAADPESNSRAAALAQSAPPAQGPYLAGDRLASFIEKYSSKIPLPPGGSFNGINWNAEFTPAQVAEQLEFNAACQWIRATVDEVRGARDVVAAASGWPTIDSVPGQQVGKPGFLNAAAAAADDPERLRTVGAYCYGLQEQLVEQAKAQGEAPPK